MLLATSERPFRAINCSRSRSLPNLWVRGAVTIGQEPQRARTKGRVYWRKTARRLMRRNRPLI
jgi:hypothetical protein